MVARQFASTFLISPDGKRSCAQDPSFATKRIAAPAERPSFAPPPGLSSIAWITVPTGMLRKGVFRTWNGRPVMVIPRPAWLALEPIERRALVEHLRLERGIEVIHVGRLVPSSRFEGQAIAVEERVWP